MESYNISTEGYIKINKFIFPFTGLTNRIIKKSRYPKLFCFKV